MVTAQLKVAANGFLDGTGSLTGFGLDAMSEAFHELGLRIGRLKKGIRKACGDKRTSVILMTDHSHDTWVNGDPWVVVNRDVYRKYHTGDRPWVPHDGWRGPLAFTRPISSLSDLTGWMDWVQLPFTYYQLDLPDFLGRPADKVSEVFHNTNLLALELQRKGLRVGSQMPEWNPDAGLEDARTALYEYFGQLRRECLSSVTLQQERPELYWTAKKIMEEFGETYPAVNNYNRLRSLLRKNPEIRHRSPNPHRLLVNVTDLLGVVSSQSRADDDADSDGPQEIERQKREVRKGKEAAR